MTYKDRSDAGKLLAFHIKTNISTDDMDKMVVLGLDRGGVVVAAEIAKECGCALDVLVVKKLGHPENPEYAAGAVSEHEIFLNPANKLSPQYITEQTHLLRKEISHKQVLYHGTRAPAEIAKKYVLLVDDGIATGLSMKVAIAEVKRHMPEKISIATPVASQESVSALSTMVHRVFSLYNPMFFAAVGQFYRNFEQTTNEEVINLIRHHAA